MTGDSPMPMSGQKPLAAFEALSWLCANHADRNLKERAYAFSVALEWRDSDSGMLDTVTLQSWQEKGKTTDIDQAAALFVEAVEDVLLKQTMGSLRSGTLRGPERARLRQPWPRPADRSAAGGGAVRRRPSPGIALLPRLCRLPLFGRSPVELCRRPGDRHPSRIGSLTGHLSEICRSARPTKPGRRASRSLPKLLLLDL